MISLAGRDVLHSWGKFVFTGVGLGLLIGVTLVMAGVYRGTPWGRTPNRPASTTTCIAPSSPFRAWPPRPT